MTGCRKFYDYTDKPFYIGKWRRYQSGVYMMCEKDEEGNVICYISGTSHNDGSVPAEPEEVEATDIKQVKIIDTVKPKKRFQFFEACWCLATIEGLNNLDVSGIIDMQDMFRDCALTNLNDMENWDTSNVVRMDGMFNHNVYLEDISALANWDTSNVTTMRKMFETVMRLKDFTALANWDTSNVVDMSRMFRNCLALEDITALANWDTSNVVRMDYMFDGCREMKDISPLSTWNTSSCENMSGLFHLSDRIYNEWGVEDLTPLANWNTSKVKNMDALFSGTAITTLNGLERWDTSHVLSMDRMFSRARDLTDISALANWDTSNVTSICTMFESCRKLQDISPLGSWDVSKVTQASWLFAACYALDDITVFNQWYIDPEKQPCALNEMIDGCRCAQKGARYEKSNKSLAKYEYHYKRVRKLLKRTPSLGDVITYRLFQTHFTADLGIALRIYHAGVSTDDVISYGRIWDTYGGRKTAASKSAIKAFKAGVPVEDIIA